ncbi:MAG: HypC/HybG/HupF family hydrogenase formation chaperone [Gemmatimonadaceae bacterium]
MCLAIPGRITSMRDDAGLTMGDVDFGDVRRDACLQHVADDVSVGGYVIVHVGFAIATLDEKEACQAGVPIVAGDTKVVERGKADGIFINTTGIGAIDPAFRPAPARAQAGEG